MHTHTLSPTFSHSPPSLYPSPSFTPFLFLFYPFTSLYFSTSFTHSLIASSLHSTLPYISYHLYLSPYHCTTPHHTTLTVLSALNSASHSVAVLSAVEVRMIDWEHRRVSRKKGREDALLTQNLGKIFHSFLLTSHFSILTIVCYVIGGIAHTNIITHISL